MSEFVEYLIHDLLGSIPNITTRAMFGGHGVYKVQASPGPGINERTWLCRTALQMNPLQRSQAKLKAKTAKIFGIVIDQQLYLKTDDALAQKYAAAGAYPFTYQRGPGVARNGHKRENMAMPDSLANKSFAAQPDEALAKTGTYSMKYFCVPETILEDRETLLEWVALSCALPPSPTKERAK